MTKYVLPTGVTVNSSIWVTSSAGVPTWQTTIPGFTTSSITFSPTTGGIVGTTTNDNAAAGKVGEIISSVIAASGAVTAVRVTATDITSISLTAGDWDVWGNIMITNGGTSPSGIISWVSATSATLPDASLYMNLSGSSSIWVANTGFTVPQLRFSLASPATIYLSVYLGNASGNGAACGGIYARRVR